MSQWIDFKKLRSQLKFSDVLEFFKVEVKAKGNQHTGYCPLPKHEGKRNSPSFSAHLERGIFHCFGCGAKGNVLEFAVLMRGENPENSKALRAVALELQERFGIGDVVSEKQETKATPPKEQNGSPRIVAVNTPLDFELKGLDSRHPYIAKRGITEATANHFGIGVASRGSLVGKLAIPLVDRQARLVGYAGRVIDDSTITQDNPRYRFPGRRERNGAVLEFRKSLMLYNAFRFREAVPDLIVVEGFVSVWWLYQLGFPYVVALMGTDCSERQAELVAEIVPPSGKVWVIPDGDRAGIQAGPMIAGAIAEHRLTRWVRLPEGKQPTDLEAEDIRNYLR